MLFNSLEFLIFFPIVCLVYFAIPKKIKWVWLLISSYYFYMCWNPKYAFLMFLSSVITWASGGFISKFNSIENEKKQKIYKNITVFVSFFINLLILFFFKYFDFTIGTINSVFSKFGIELINPSFDVILPVGISFYTFQALSYTMDVYRGDTTHEKNLFRYMLFVSFFPQLVAGPIERSKNLLHQLKKSHKFDAKRIKSGLILMLWGFFQKLVIADRLAILVNEVYNNYSAYGSVEIILATLLFAFQIYCDFASYTDIARGGAEVMGFSLMNNFRQPYFATSIADFWRKWHISLSGWFKDYLYIPLGGNKKGVLRKYFNVMVVFLTSGLWHGASWHFVIWGALHGVYQIIGDATKGIRQKGLKLLKVKENSHYHRFFQRVITFSLVLFGWIFFRANTSADAFEIVKRLFTMWNPWAITNGTIFSLGLDSSQMFAAFISLLILGVVSTFHYYKKSFRRIILNTHIIVRWTFVFALIFTILIFGIYGPGYSESQFIYFQF